MKIYNFKSLQYYLLFSTCFLLSGASYAKYIFTERGYELDLVKINYVIYTIIVVLLLVVVYVVLKSIIKPKKDSNSLKKNYIRLILGLSFWSTLFFLLGFYSIDQLVIPIASKAEIILRISFYQFLFLLMFIELVTLGMLIAFTKKE